MQEQSYSQEIKPSEENQEINRSCLIRTPYNFESLNSVQKIINKQLINQIQLESSPTLTLPNPLYCALEISVSRKKLTRPIQLIRTKKLIHKKTGKMIRLIKQTKNIQFIYDYEDMGDFISSTGSNSIYQKKKYSLQQTDILQEIRRVLYEKIGKQNQGKQINHGLVEMVEYDKYLELIQPISFLKSYNLAPPVCDMLSSKLKPQKSQPSIFSFNINYQDEVPLKPPSQPPSSLKQHPLFIKISGYLQKRPCWLKNSLYYTLYQQGWKDKFTITDFKSIMRFLCYTYRTGPWKHTLCRFGFNPREQYRSLIYQSITIKMKQKEVEDYQNEVQEDVYDPRFKEISSRCIRAYQLCDIENQEIREIVNGKMIAKEGECTKEYGWLSGAQYGAIMKEMKRYIEEQRQGNHKKQE